MYRNGGKRVADVVLSLLLLLVTAPLFVLIMLCLTLTASERVFFCQTRIGKHSRPFTICKFCTMRSEAPHDVATRDLKTPEAYITPLGRILRQTSLDELPQLWNVLKGDMSLVGPRPVVPAETHLIRLRQMWGADVCAPGITGLAQVRGRERLGYFEKAQYDAEYAHRLSFKLDVQILAQTVRCVLRRENIEHSSRKEKEPPQSAEGA